MKLLFNLFLVTLAVLQPTKMYSITNVVISPIHYYVSVSSDGSKLTFSVSSKTILEDEHTFEIKTKYTEAPKWCSPSVKEVVFESDLFPENTAYWFYGCSNLTTIEGIEKLNVDRVQSMAYMFYGCRSLTTLDLSNFNTYKLKSCINMFSYCSKLRTIYGNHWDILANLTEEEYKKFLIFILKHDYSMFYGCTSLMGGNGTVCNSSVKHDYKYAHIDGGISSPGYFTLKPASITAYAVLRDDTLTFYYDDKTHAHIGKKYQVQSDSLPGWTNGTQVKTAIVDASFSQYSPTKVNLFANCYSLNKIEGIEHLNLDNVTDLSGMFSDCYSLKTINLSGLNTASVTKMDDMFYRCYSLENLQLASLDTRNVTDMSYMFGSCISLKELDLNSLNTSKVTNMKGMFGECLSLKTIKMNNFLTEAVTNMEGMFKDCESLTDLDLKSFNTHNVKSMASMFSKCYSLTSLDLKHFNTENVTNMQTMFGDDGRLATTPIPSPTWYKYYTDIKSKLELPESKSKLKTLDLTNMNTSNVTNMYGMFSNCQALTSLELRNFNTENVTDMGQMFDGCESLQTLNISTFNTDNVTNLAAMFKNCANLPAIDLNGFNTVNVTNMSNLFYRCKKIQELYLSGFNTNKTTTMTNMFKDCESLRAIYVQGLWDTSNLNNSTEMFAGCNSLVGGSGTTYNPAKTDGAYAHIDGGVKNPGYLSDAVPNIELTGKQPYAVYYNNVLTFYYDEQVNNRAGVKYTIKSDYTVKNQPQWVRDYNRNNIHKAVFDSSFSSYQPTSTAFWFYQCNKLKLIEGFENLNTSQVTNMREMFRYCSVLNNLDLRTFDTSNVVDMSCMFCYCWGLTNVNVSNFNTTKVLSMTHMFHQCPISSIDVSNFDTENVLDMSVMFMECKKLKTLDLKNFNTNNLIDASYMFARSPSLTTIYASDLWTINNVTESERMFWDTNRIVGGMGTKYDANHIDKEYAIIDEGIYNPGYLTGDPTDIVPEPYVVYNDNTLTFYYDKKKHKRQGNIYDIADAYIWTPEWCQEDIYTAVFDKSFENYHPQSTKYWFDNCHTLTTILDTHYLKTDNVTDMYGMFSFCENLTDLDLSNFDTRKVIDMSYMFYHCQSLKNLDLSSFDTSNVTDMAGMFSCCMTSNLNLSSFNTSNVTDMLGMFSCCKTSNLNLSNFNTENVTDMREMFDNCDVTDFDITSFNTKKVTSMNAMFRRFKMTNLDLSNFDTKNVKDMGGMFSSSIFENLNITSFNTENITYMDYMFSECKVKNLDLSYFNTENVKSMSHMFSWSDIMNLNISSFNTENVTNMECMFHGCKTKNLDLSNFNTENVTNMCEMFENSDVTDLDITSFNTNNVTNMHCMFSDTVLEILDLSSFNTSKVKDMYHMFYHCEKLKTIFVSDYWTTENVPIPTHLFLSCPNLVGGQGTTYNYYHVDISYAHIDEGPSNPGYFTYKYYNDIPEITNTYSISIDNNYYTIDGRRLYSVPKQKGVYIYQGKKIMVK